MAAIAFAVDGYSAATRATTRRSCLPRSGTRSSPVLTAHQCSVEATQAHGHYLKGTIHCGQCGSRLIVSNAKNRHGNAYCYFVCPGRHSKRTDCTRQAILIEDVEKLVEGYYTRVQITPAQQDALAGMLHHEFDPLVAAETEELERLTTNRDRL